MSKPLTALGTLVAARKLIENPNNWIKGALARDSNNFIINVKDQMACKFCTSGAVQKVTDYAHDLTPYHEAYIYLDKAAITLNNSYNTGYIHRPCVAFNDACTHDEVMDMFDLAIKFAQHDEVVSAS